MPKTKPPKKKPAKKQSSLPQSKSTLKIIASVVGILVLPFLIMAFKGNKTIKIGLNAELSGELSAIGQSSRNGAELAVNQINKKGGVRVSGKKHKLKLVVEDNKSNAAHAAAVVSKLINKGVLALVGPNASKFAIAAADMAEANQTLMISPWSTNPQTTLNSSGTPKDYVFRAAFLDSFQAEAFALFVFSNLELSRAAVIYDETAEVLKGQAEIFENTFEEGSGTITSTQSFKAGDKDFSKQLQIIQRSNPDVIFLPAYYNDAANIIRQARIIGIKSIFLGSDAWGGQEILNVCGSDCKGAYLSAHFSADSDNPLTKAFVEEYQQAYDIIPGDVAALTFDSVNLVARAIENGGIAESQAVAEGMYQVSDFEGVTGDMKFNKESRDPKKSVDILQINDGKFEWIENINP